MQDEATQVAAEEPAVVEATPEVVEEATPEEVTPKGLRENIESAIEAVDNPKSEPSEEKPTTQERERNPDETFKAKEETPEAVVEETQEPAKEPSKFDEPPNRFSPDAKAAWAELPETVKAETHRAFTEMEAGIQKYQEAFEPYRALDQDLKERGQTIDQVVNHYRGIENLLQKDPIAGLQQVCSNLGLTLQQVAEHVTGKEPDKQANELEQVIQQQNNQIRQLEQRLNGVDTNIKSQAEAQMLKEVEAFAKDKPRFEELGADIAYFIQTGRAKDLQEAYDYAERLNPAPVTAEPTPQPQPETAQTRKGQLSTTGAPASGSNPANRKPPSSAREAIERQMAAAGLGA